MILINTTVTIATCIHNKCLYYSQSYNMIAENIIKWKPARDIHQRILTEKKLQGINVQVNSPNIAMVRWVYMPS